MLTRHLTNKILEVRLEEEKFYFPGETIKGLVIVHPKNAIKVNLIQLKFSGQVYVHLKEKETDTLFQESLTLSVCPNSTSSKQTTLDPSEHTFPFKFIVPKNLNLPSSMEFGKKGHIRYTIHALLDRPMLPESLCPKVEYPVSLLEYIDIEKAQFKVPQEKSQDIMLPHAKYNQKCMVKASMPRLGFTRGDIVPLKVTVDHFTSYSRKDSVKVELVRTVEIRTAKHTVFKEAVLRTTHYGVDLKEPNLSQSIVCQMLIPTSTPPSIRYKDKVLRFHYKIRVSVLFEGDVTSTLDLPIVVGTWPRAAVPIEDDDDAFAHDIHDSVLTDEEDGEGDDADIESLRTCSVDDQASVRRRTSSSILPSWHTNNSSTSTLITAQRNSMISANGDTFVGRSDSVASKASNRSHNSVSSWKSSKSWEQHHQFGNHKSHSTNNLTRNTSQSTTLSSPDRLPSYGGYTNSSHTRSTSIYSNDSSTYPSNNNNHRHSMHSYSSVQQQQQAYYNNNQPYYNTPQQQQMFYNAHQQRQPIVNMPPQMNYQPQNVNNLNRLSRYSANGDHPLPPPQQQQQQQAPIVLEQDVPTHILEPLSSGFVPMTSPIHEQPEYSPYMQPTLISPTDSGSDLSSSSAADSDDEDDLLAIIERKKKKERRELRKQRQQQQQQQATTTTTTA